MGVGKSTVGPLLAQRMGWDFIDSDHWIEAQTGKVPADWIESQGERSFREIESQCLEALSSSTPLVVALGGGAFCEAGDFPWLNSQSVVVYLRASLAILKERIQTGSEGAAQIRPLLKRAEGEFCAERMEELLKKREPFYEKADYSILTDGKTPQVVAQEIDALLHLSCNRIF
jgi:shikimate kinase